MTSAVKTVLETAIANAAAALAADLEDPKPDYNVDGQQVSRSQYRDNLMKIIREANETINADTAVWRKTNFNSGYC